MIYQFRSLVNTTAVKIILVFSAVGFAFVGIGDVITGMNDVVLVKFAKLDDIRLSEFYKLKKNIMSQIQSSSNFNSSPEIMTEIDDMAIKSLIKERFYKGWINDSGLVVGDKIVAAYIKTVPKFHDEKGKFSLAIFKNVISSTGTSDDEFYDDLRRQIAGNLLDKAVAESSYMPKMLQDIILSYLATEKSAQYIEVDLTDKAILPGVKPSEEDLQKFYDKDPEFFKVAEKRSVKYFTLELPSPQLPSSKKEDEEARKEEEFAKEFLDKIKNLEDSVASGETLEEIAKKYNLQIKTFSGSIQDFSKNNSFTNNASQIFEMKQGETSYPLDIEEGKKILICEIDSITESKIPTFGEAKNEVLLAYLKNACHVANLNRLNDFVSQLKEKAGLLTEKDFAAATKEFGYKPKNFTLLLGKPEYNLHNLPIEVVIQIVNSAPGAISEIIEFAGRAYLAYVTNSLVNKKQEESFRKDHLENLKNHFSNTMIEEVLAYYYYQNHPEVKKELLGNDG